MGHLCKDDTWNGLESHTVLRVKVKGDGFPNENYQCGLNIKEKKTTPCWFNDLSVRYEEIKSQQQEANLQLLYFGHAESEIL